MDEEEKAFQEVLLKIEASPKTALEKKAFFTIAKLIFYNGLEQKEITKIKVGDVLQGGSILAEITPTAGEGSTRLSEEVKQAIGDYLQDLSSGSPVTPDSLLFPAYGGENGVRNLRRHFEPFLGSLTFDDLRRAGASAYFKTLIGNGVDQLTALKETARQFRLGKRTVDDIRRGTTQQAGKKVAEKQYAYERVYYLWEELEQSLDWYDVIIKNRIPKLVEEYFEADDDLSKWLIENKWSNQAGGTISKDIFLNDIIKKLRLSMTEIEKQVKRIKEELLIPNFEDTDNTHTPEEKLEIKKGKLLEYIKTILSNIPKKEKNKLVRERKKAKEQREKEKEKLEKSKNRKQRGRSWISPEGWRYRQKLSAKRERARGTGAFPDRPESKSKTIIRIGIIDSGGTDEEDQYYTKAWDLARKRINAAGGVRRKFFEVISQPGVSPKQFVERYNVLALVGPVRSTKILSISDEVKNLGIPMAIGGTNVTITQQGNPWLFRCRPDDSLVSNAMVEYIKDDLKLTRVGILHDSDVFGTGGADLVVKNCIPKGLTVVKRENYTTSDKNYLTQLESIKNAGAQVMVVYGTSPEDVGLIQQQYRTLCSSYEYLGSPSSGMKACLQISGKAAEGLTMIGDYVPGRRAAKKYANKYREEYKASKDSLDDIEVKDLPHYKRLLHDGEMDPTAAWYYDALRILARGVKAGGMDRKKIMEAILAINDYEGVLGTYSFTPNGDGLHKVSVIRIVNGWHVLTKIY